MESGILMFLLFSTNNKLVMSSTEVTNIPRSELDHELDGLRPHTMILVNII